MPRKIRVLIVEDSEDDAELVRLELERNGFVVEHRRVETEAAFVEALERNGWDFIISDFKMPAFDGLRAFEIFRDRHLDVPFIFVSGALGEERAVEAMRAGARDYLLKGNLGRLSVTVERELEEARNRRRRRQAEDAEQRQHRRLTLAMEATRAGIFECRLLPERSVHLDQRCAELLGISPGEVAGADAAKLFDRLLGRIHSEDREVLREGCQKLASGADQRLELRVRLSRNGDPQLTLRCLVQATDYDGAGRVAGAVGVVLDETEREQVQEQLRQAQKMEAVGRLAGGVAHDFNNILTAVVGFARFAMAEMEPDHPARQDAEEIISAARRAESLTRQLLAFSRRHPVEPLVVDVKELLDGLSKMIHRLLGETIDTRIRHGANLWNTRIDPGAFEQLVVNLAVNAGDAMPDGGTLTIETTNLSLIQSIMLADGDEVPPGDYVLLTVGDDGVGMELETKGRIFEPFFTTKEASKGTGLGLSTCYGIVKQASGHVRVRSAPGRGTTFEIYLPRVAGAKERRRVDSTPPSLGGTETILVVEDDPPLLRLAVRALKRLGYSVLKAADGEQALALAEKHIGPIHLIVTDVVMPKLSGFELSRRIVRTHPEAKILYMSGYTANRIAEQGVLPSGALLLRKPFSPDALATKVRQVLDADGAVELDRG